MRLDKFLADANAGTRSQVKEKIKKKQVLVDGKIVTDAGYQVTEENEVICSKVVIKPSKNGYFMFYKPAGCVSATVDRGQTVLDYFQDVACKGLFPVGRLDKDTEGLLLITNDGVFSHRLMSPQKHVPKLYYFEGMGHFDACTASLFEKGMDIGDETLTKPAKIMYQVGDLGDRGSVYGNLETDYLERLLQQNQLYEKQHKKTDVTGLVMLTEGRFHQVKRMLLTCGVTVWYLKRIAIGNLYLDETLLPGEWKELGQEDFRKLGILDTL